LTAQGQTAGGHGNSFSERAALAKTFKQEAFMKPRDGQQLQDIANRLIAPKRQWANRRAVMMPTPKNQWTKQYAPKA